jgi:hypothetical protein
MTFQHFSSTRDFEFLERASVEKHRLYFKPRRWLVNSDTLELNIYGEPGDPVSATDGVTSIPATRNLTSSLTNFNTEGVLAGDILEIETPSCNDGDNGRYQVDSVVSDNVIKISEDWPEGSLTSLVFNVHFLNERFVEFDQLLPFNVILNPTQKELTKWGISEKRDALVILNRKIFRDANLTPKIGDRFIYEYGNRDIHYEIQNLFDDGQLNDNGSRLYYLGTARRTTNQLP